MTRTDYRFNRSEQPLDPPDDGLDEDERYERDLRRDLASEARMDEMRELSLQRESW